MKKRKDIILNLSDKFKLKYYKNTLDKETYNKLKKIISKLKREYKKHFKEDGWDISLDHIKDRVFMELFNIDLTLVIVSEFYKFTNLKYKDGKGLLVKK